MYFYHDNIRNLAKKISNLELQHWAKLHNLIGLHEGRSTKRKNSKQQIFRDLIQ